MKEVEKIHVDVVLLVLDWLGLLENNLMQFCAVVVVEDVVLEQDVLIH